MCCAHVFNQVDVCHSTPLIFTDGACLANGHRNAQAGIGVAVGMCEKDQMAAPVDDRMDGVGKRTNQRAELLAALEGLKMMSRITPIDDDEAQRLRDQADRGEFVILAQTAIVMSLVSHHLSIVMTLCPRVEERLDNIPGHGTVQPGPVPPT